jgi:hypothetical protein
MGMKDPANRRPDRGQDRPARPRLIGRLVATLTVIIPLPAVATQLWLSGVDPIVRRVMEPNVRSDYTDLFRPGSPWSRAAANIQVFKTSTQFLTRASDEQLRQMFAFLKEKHIAIATAALMLTAPGMCGQNIEGYSAPGTIEALATRVKRLGGELSYMAMDEPLWFGHRYNGPRACRSSIADVAKDVARRVAAIRRIFPNVQVGDIEPFAVRGQPVDWLDEIAQWIAAYRAATGENLAFFHVDMDWHQDWRAQLPGLVPVLKAARIKFGIIYDGDPDDTSGIAWTRHAEERFAAVEADAALVPDQAILQTWMRHPAHMLPETQPGTMTWLVNRYAAAETRITVQRVGDRLTGQLVGADGQPLAGKRLQITAVDVTNAGPPAEVIRSGTVPRDATRALFALRINQECNCSGPVDVTFGPPSYRDDRTGERVVRAFQVRGARPVPGGVRIIAPAGQPFMPNTLPWPVRPGDPWTVEVAMGTTEASQHSGYVALIFQDQTGKGIQRIPLWFQLAKRPIGQASTNAAGQFTLALSPALLQLNPAFEIEFGGDDAFRPSSIFLP